VKISATRQCSRCHGTGKHGSVEVREGVCFSCHGTGRVKAHAKSVSKAERETKLQAERDAFNAMLANWNTSEVVALGEQLKSVKQTQD
jgi:hypothetical protein